MLNHAASVNHKKQERNVERRRQDGTSTIEDDFADAELVDGRRLSEMTSDEILSHHDGAKPRTIKLPKKE
jgi:hypothetical protein